MTPKPPANASPSPIAEGFAPGLLIASPTLADPNFEQTVLLMVGHDVSGAQGFIINREGAVKVEAVIKGALDGASLPEGVDGAASVGWGGPVEEGSLWVLYQHETEATLPDDTQRVAPGLSLGSAQHLRAALDAGLGTPRLVMGYAGWGPMQLEREVMESAWLPMNLDMELLFEVPVERCWAEALRRLGLTPGAFVMGNSGGRA